MSEAPVSVVIATRDRPQMVREAVDAALAQDYPGPIDVVVVFDQSEPDMSMERSDPRRSVRVISNTRTPGLPGSRNTGIEATSGTYVAFCDDDDYWLPSKVSAQVALLEEFPDAGVCTTGITVQYDGETFERVLDLDQVTFDQFLVSRYAETHSSTLMIRRSVLLERIGLVDEEMPGGFGEDYEFLLRASKVHPVINVRQALAVIRWGRQSFFFRRWQTMSEGLTWLLQRYPELDTSRRGSARIHGQIAFAHASLGNHKESLRWVGRTIRRRPLEPRAYLSLAVASGLLKPDRVMEMLHHRGKGI